MGRIKYGTMKHKHLTLSDQIEIELGIAQGFLLRRILLLFQKK